MKKTILAATFLATSALALDAQVPQKLVIEQFTGAWCGYCPDGSLIIADLTATNPDVYGVAVHNGDDMVTSAGNSVDNFYNTLGYPSATFNRNGAAIGRGSWASQAASMTGGTSNMSVSFESWTYDGATNVISVTVHVEAFGTFTGNKRLGVILTEDDVVGSGSGYNQTNYFNTTAGHPYYGAGNPIVGYAHQNVARSYLGTAWGQYGVLPYTVDAGFDTSYTFTTTLNPSWNKSNMNLIAYAAYNTGTTLGARAMINAESISMDLVTGTQEPITQAGIQMTASPNPFNERTTAAYTLDKTGNVKVEVLNTLGQQVALLAEGVHTAGTHSESWIPGDAVPSGIYFIRVSTDTGVSRSAKVMLQR